MHQFIAIKVTGVKKAKLNLLYEMLWSPEVPGPVDHLGLNAAHNYSTGFFVSGSDVAFQNLYPSWKLI